MKQTKTKPKPITAQVPDYCMPFGVNSKGKEHFQKYTQEMVSDNHLDAAVGCYRRIPTCKD